MTLVAVVTRFIRRYLCTQEAVILLILLILLYNTLFHVKPIWRYFQGSTLKIRGYERPPVNLNGATTDQNRAAWDMKKHEAAVYSVQGRRPHMEDRFNVVSKLEHTNTSIYGIFDGHGGEFAADFTEKTLFKSVMIRLLKASLSGEDLNLTTMITEEIKNVDNQLLDVLKSNMDISGTTALVAMLKNDKLTVANVGDSRGVMCDKDGKGVPLSYDHKPHMLKERKRIKESGGFVSFNGVWRVGGVLATSRALGDYPLKEKKFITCEPDIEVFDLNELKPQFLILATDGLWDCFGNQEAVDYIKDRLHEPHYGAKSLVLQAYYRGSQDNISVMVVNLAELLN